MRAALRIGLVLVGTGLGAGLGLLLWFAPAAAPSADPAAVPRAGTLTPAPAPVVGAPAPDFSLPDPAGKTAALSALRGTAVVVNFWATWCDPCRTELPLLDRIAAEHAGALVVLGVEAGDPEADVRAFAADLNLSALRILTDPAGRVRDLYLVRGLPTTFFVDGRGIVRRIKIGVLDSAEIESILKDLGVNP
jgi:cytochrome c biogenesis protein CcmG/thiol:disulfide interchange protein DsbE